MDLQPPLVDVSGAPDAKPEEHAMSTISTPSASGGSAIRTARRGPYTPASLENSRWPRHPALAYEESTTLPMRLLFPPLGRPAAGDITASDGETVDMSGTTIIDAPVEGIDLVKWFYGPDER